MINTKENRRNERNKKNQEENSKQNSIFSLKNNREFQCSCETERLLMVLIEFDPLSDSYKQFEFKWSTPGISMNLNQVQR